MKSTKKWLLIPPAIAAMLIMGTLSMQSGSDQKGAPSAPPTAVEPANPAPTNRREPTALPRAPDLWQMGSALTGVLLLGIGAVLLLRRLRGPSRAPRGANLMALRQTLRLSTRQAVHAIEFDDRILLIGETDRGIALLDSGKLPERAADEAEVQRRAASSPHSQSVDVVAGDDDGAVPKDLVIPRPAQPQPRRLPTPAGMRAAEREQVGLADFRNLLQKAGRS